MRAEFKEKTYEKYFGFELARRTNVTFSPDPCDEAFLGFDDAFFLELRWLWRLAPYIRRSRRSRLHGLRISELDHICDAITKRCPPFKFNLFVQYKRPEYLSRSSALEWPCWQRPYFRYEITPHQQGLLARIEQQSHGRAATIYASPAFWQTNDLWDHVEAERVVDQSNMASVGRLNGHTRFSYCAAGSFGRGHSDPVDVESPSFQQTLEGGMRQEGLSFNEHIKLAARRVNESVTGDELAASLLAQARAAILGGEGSEGERPIEESLLYALATIEAFRDAFDISFYAVG